MLLESAKNDDKDEYMKRIIAFKDWHLGGREEKNRGKDRKTEYKEGRIRKKHKEENLRCLV